MPFKRSYRQLIIFLLVMGIDLWFVPLFIAPAPDLMLGNLFYCAIHTSMGTPALWPFLVGGLYDFNNNYPIGFYSLLFQTFYCIVFLQRVSLQNKSFIVIWAGFCFCTGCFVLGEIMLNTLLGIQWTPAILVWRSLNTILSWPLLSGLYYAATR